ncbi:MAG: Kazal-type serine protease inhibitor domain-containing protein [Candidatus Binatia bacterium]
MSFLSTAPLVFSVVVFAGSAAPAVAQTDAADSVEVLPIQPVDRPYDHLKCFKIKDRRRLGALADLYPLQNPPFPVDKGCRLKLAAREFCIPVHKELGPSLSADIAAVDLTGQDLVNDFLCYRLKCPRTPLPNGWPVVDQFGRRIVKGFKPLRLCAPARKLPVQQACCDPRQQPGQNGVPTCVEGATCCNDGVWRCNDEEGLSTCPIAEGRVCRRCCNPTEEPGTDGNPSCFEGHSCCADGRWRCNEADGSSSCAIDGVVCDGCCLRSMEPGADGNPLCIEGHSCCSTGEWQCNDAGTNSTCLLNGQACDCCDPRTEPGQFGNPLCIEGYSCCANGEWRCNDASGQSTCRFEGERCSDVCGGIQGIGCDAGEYCMLEEGQCCCDFQGLCTSIPGQCPAVIDPVCGCDGVTYNNDCEAARAGVSVDHRGRCASCGGIEGILCPKDQFCLLDTGQCCCDFQGKCIDPPQACPLVSDPVCGCDGVTYNNACEALQARINVDHRGPCNGSVTP